MEMKKIAMQAATIMVLRKLMQRVIGSFIGPQLRRVSGPRGR